MSRTTITKTEREERYEEKTNNNIINNNNDQMENPKFIMKEMNEGNMCWDRGNLKKK